LMTTQTSDRPGAIHARPVRHPGRWVAIAVIVVLVAMMISSLVTNPVWNFSRVLKVMNFNPVLNGLFKGTLIGTVGAMIIGVVLGILMAVMRLSGNPVLRGVAFAYVWFFRSMPRYVLLIFCGSLGVLYAKLDIGVPFGHQLAKALGWDTTLAFTSINMNALSSSLAIGILGLGLSEAAYMAEIARAGILSVDQGQNEAAQALGMGPGKAMTRIILPQAMRVIVPPTGNETISMVKDTSLLSAVPITAELFYQAQAIGNQSFQIVPSLVAASLWYIIVCSILMVGQSYLERYFGRGFGTPSKKARQQLTQVAADH
ncbi:MAG: amino acid ABC transporter permease, partial [Nostocoides sp.]